MIAFSALAHLLDEPDMWIPALDQDAELREHALGRSRHYWHARTRRAATRQRVAKRRGKPGGIGKIGQQPGTGMPHDTPTISSGNQPRT
jgi:hypothetical protein